MFFLASLLSILSPLCLLSAILFFVFSFLFLYRCMFAASSSSLPSHIRIRVDSHLVFDRSPNVKPDSVLFITSASSIKRYDIESGVLSTLNLVDAPERFDPVGIDCTATGHVIVSCCSTHSVYVIDPSVGSVKRLASSGECGFADLKVPEFSSPYDLQIVDSERCAYLCDEQNNRIRRITLPFELFDPFFDLKADLSAPAPAPDPSAPDLDLLHVLDYDMGKADGQSVAADGKVAPIASASEPLPVAVPPLPAPAPSAIVFTAGESVVAPFPAQPGAVGWVGESEGEANDNALPVVPGGADVLNPSLTALLSGDDSSDGSGARAVSIAALPVSQSQLRQIQRDMKLLFSKIENPSVTVIESAGINPTTIRSMR